MYLSSYDKNVSYDIGTFSIGDKVYSIKHKLHAYKIPVRCEYCNNTGFVYLKGRKFKCPNCEGRQRYEQVTELLVNKKPITIKSVLTYKDKNNAFEIYAGNNSGDVIIMKTDNGESLFFRNFSDAQKYCDKHNTENHVYEKMERYKRFNV